MNKYSVYLPCRAGSERVRNKNTKPFHKGRSLLQYKLDMLDQIEPISDICVSTNDAEVKRQISKSSYKKVYVFDRDESLCRSTTPTGALVTDMLNICASNFLIWTHVTSPLLSKATILECVKRFELEKDFDSLMTVNKIQNFLWMDGVPINYDREENKWPNTQTLNPVYEINSGLFIIGRDMAEQYQDRIGRKPYLFETIFPENIDIDWPEDFELAQELISRRF